jgi:hypothetical protein
MPLSPPIIDRSLLHTRTIVCEGFARDDGLWDIDGWLTDVKSYDVDNIDRGGIPAGEPVHGMGLRMTIDMDLVIRDIVAVSDHTPFRMCAAITPAFRSLIGVSLAKGFNRAVRERLGGIKGCVHLVDLLGPMATVAYQTLDEPNYRRWQEAAAHGEPAEPIFVNACHAWADTGELVKREFPALYKAESQ